MKTEKTMTLLLVMQGLILASQWAGPIATPRTAQAEPFNPGERQLAILEENRQTNARLDKLLALLQSGEVQVKIVKEEAK